MFARWGLIFILADILIAAALVGLLSRREAKVPCIVAWLMPFTGRWAYYFLVGIVVAAYAGLAPLFLGLWIHNFKR